MYEDLVIWAIIGWIIILLMLGLTIGAAVRGWKGWVAIPAAAFVIGWLMGIFSVETNIIPAILMYGSLLAVLIMTITGHKDKSRSVTPPPPVYPVYPYPNQPGIPYSPAANVPPPPVPAPTPSTVIYRGSSLVLPDGNKILLTEATRALGRTDFERIVAPGSANVISRQHFMIMSQQGQFYARDNNSANGTRINGIDIKGKDWQLLNDGDRIEVAGVMTLTYKNG